MDVFAYLGDAIGRISNRPSNKLPELPPDPWEPSAAAQVTNPTWPGAQFPGSTTKAAADPSRGAIFLLPSVAPGR